MAETVLGIDFGCSNITIQNKNGLLLKQPNVMAVKKIGEDVEFITAGERAKTMLGKATDNVYVFYPVNAGEIVSVNYAILELKKIFKSLGLKFGFFSRLKVIAPIPSGISFEEQTKYTKLFKGVGAREVICIPKLFLTALGENINIGANSAKLIVDIGGGNVECGVINLNTLICSSSLGIGGRTLDLTIIDYIKQKYQIIIGENTAQTLKEQIFSLYASDTAKMDVNGVSSLDNSPVTITVFAKDIFEATHSFYDEIIKIIRTTISSLSPEISSDVVRNGIYVCGGLSKVPGLDKYFKQKLGINVFISYESENSNIKGMSTLLLHSDILDNILKNL